ncbi:uncharacterized protein LOC119104821 [Pollicipes pollicipes]|uniref:uncharacterized protein LOC119104821 n=1 Tax=Pollicipes pollicipes TaxID=41117 RepID=UPI0018851DB2|nr:uncharacterized protein LOC119104821 [Pollicipes pollicipes]
MNTSTLALLLLALVALAAAAPTPDRDDDDDDYDYEYDYDDEYDDEYEEQRRREEKSLPFAIFEDVQPRSPRWDQTQPSVCAWGVVQCCDIPNRRSNRADCFARLGCSGAWFTDLCTPTIKQTIFKMVLDSLRKH